MKLHFFNVDIDEEATMLTPREYRERLVRIERCRRNVFDHMRRYKWSKEEMPDAMKHQIACLRRHNRVLRGEN